MAAIIVINDDLPLATFLGDLLQTRGGDLIVCSGSYRTYDTLKRAHFDLIILDLVTSKPEGGWDILTFLQLHPVLHHVPVIVCSGPTDELIAKESWLKERSIGVLIKPFDLEDLYTKVDESLRRVSIKS